ncbi:MAG: serine/threonine-protein kinase [Acidobacteria bacterium]|nr:serine/threonine-protein kinase [Acidobacteriota bacterium]
MTSGDQTSQSSGPTPGGRLKDRYLIERELGRGGVGVVFLARDERLHGMPVVIKFLLEAAGQNQWLTGKFSQEAEALTRINHPGVVRVIDRDLSDDGRPFFVMEFIKGRPLRNVINSELMDLAYAARMVRQIGNALHAAHQQGIVHRDLKPENIMLEQLSDGEEQIKLIDFGIAKVTNPQAGNETEVAVVAGSRQYIAPEQLLSQTASPATDIYAMAIIVYEMVTGRLPFNPQGPTHFLVMQELMRLQQSESFVKPQTFRPDLPGAAQTLLINALSFDPRRRPQNARIFAEDLAQALTGNIKIAGERATIAVPAPPVGSAPVGSAPVGSAPVGSDRSPAREIIAEASLDTAPIEQIKTAGVKATDKIPASPPSAPNLPGGWTAPNVAIQTSNLKPKGRILPIIAGLIIVAIAAGIALKTLTPSAESDSKQTALETPTPPAPEPAASTTAMSGPAASEAERTINYSVTMRKDPKRYPNSSPFQVPGEVIFSPGDRVHFSFISPQRGYLYIINESPPAKGQASSFNILFPAPTANQGSAQLYAGQTVRIPDHDIGFVFDEEQGTEKLWLIWAAAELAELEPLKRWANPQDVGAIKDAAQIETLRAFLAAHSATEPHVTRDETSKQTMVKVKGDILVKLVNLQHY